MKIAVVNTQIPFARGGSDRLADSLAGKLRERGHRVEQINIPFKPYPAGTVVQHMLACTSMRIDCGSPDLAIALRFPAYLVPFPAKRLWLPHPYAGHSGLGEGPEARALRDAIRAADAEALGAAERIFTQSRIAARRLAEHNGIQVDQVLYPPLDRPEIYLAGERRDYAFFPGRMGEAYRQQIAIEAMRFVRSPIRLVLAGKPDNPEYADRLRSLVEQHGLVAKVQFEGSITEERKAERMAHAFCAVDLPQDGDSDGYVTLEAFHSHKPVVTLRDSGGIHELVVHERNGWIAEPTPAALAAALDRLWEDRALCERLGEDGRATIERHRIHWDHVLDQLTG